MRGFHFWAKLGSGSTGLEGRFTRVLAKTNIMTEPLPVSAFQKGSEFGRRAMMQGCAKSIIEKTECGAETITMGKLQQLLHDMAIAEGLPAWHTISTETFEMTAATPDRAAVCFAGQF